MIKFLRLFRSPEIPAQKRPNAPAVSTGKVRLHPLPEGVTQPLASVIGAAVAGAIKATLTAHPIPMTNGQRGTLIGSARKRAVNQILCAENLARLRQELAEDRA